MPRLLNSDFDLEARGMDCSTFFCLRAQRVKAQMRNYRRGVTFGIIENKLLSHTLLSALGMPVLPVLYGAFARNPLGPWPRYNRTEFIAAMRQACAKVNNGSAACSFVVKPISSGGSDFVHIMSPERWRRHDHVAEFLADRVDHMLRPGGVSNWGQLYEQGGIMVQQRAAADAPQLTPQARPGMRMHHGREGGPQKQAARLVEIKAPIVWGDAFCGRVVEVNGLPNASWVEVAFEESGTSCIDVSKPPGRGSEPPLRRQPRLAEGDAEHRCNTSSGPLDKALHAAGMHRAVAEFRHLARRLYQLLGADWFRLDAFVEPHSGKLYVNELTYPSHEALPSTRWGARGWTEQTCGLGRLGLGYRQNVRRVDAQQFWRPLLQRMQVSEKTFLASGFDCLTHPPSDVSYEVFHTALRYPVALAHLLHPSPHRTKLRELLGPSSDSDKKLMQLRPQLMQFRPQQIKAARRFLEDWRPHKTKRPECSTGAGRARSEPLRGGYINTSQSPLGGGSG